MKRTHLTQQQRYHIQAMFEQGYDKQDIANIQKLKSKNAKELAKKVIAVLKLYRDKVKTSTILIAIEM